MIIYLNGQYIEEKEAALSPFDHGYLYGIGAFETFRLYNGRRFYRMRMLPGSTARFGICGLRTR